MRKFVVIFLAVFMMAGLTGCSSGVSQEEYDKVVSELASMKQDYDAVVKSEKALFEEYEQYKKESAGFMNLTEAEKEAALIQAEADKVNAAEAKRVADEAAAKAAEKRKAQEAADAKAAEEARLAKEAKGYKTGITFKNISRTPDDYVGQKVTFSGSVLQVQEDGILSVIRMSTNGKYDDVIYGTYSPSILDVRLLDGDQITIYGSVVGLKSYTTVMGSIVTIPEIAIDKIELK